MSTLIVYATKHGTTEKCARLLVDQLDDSVEIVNLETNPEPKLESYETIIIGGPIYAGKIMQSVSNFTKENSDLLSQKTLGLFICGIQEEDEGLVKELENNFPQVLLDKATVKDFFGGELYFSKMGRFERWMMKKITKTEDDISEIRLENIQAFADTLNRK